MVQRRLEGHSSVSHAFQPFRELSRTQSECPSTITSQHMAGHQGPGRLIIECLLVYVLDKKGRGKLIPFTPHLLGTKESCLPTSHLQVFLLLPFSWTTVSFGSETQTSNGCFVQRFGCHMQAQRKPLVLGVGPGKILVIFKQENKKQYYNSYLLLSTYYARHFTYICAYTSHNNLGGRYYHHHFTYEEAEAQ